MSEGRQSSREMRPNVLFIMADQLRRDALGVYGSWAATPNLDALASESLVFDRAVTTSPVCMPARFSLALGRYPHNFDLWSNGPARIAPGTPTWMNDLREAGYHTSVFGKLHLGSGRNLFRAEDRMRSLGFDVVEEIHGPRACLRAECRMTSAWSEAGVLETFRRDLALRLTEGLFTPRPSPLPLDLYYDVWVPSRAVEHLESLDAGRPWFCMVSFAGPHEPWDAPEPYASMFDPVEAPPPLPVSPPTEDGPPSTLDKHMRFAAGLPEQSIRELRANYAGSVALIDDQVGRLLDVVRRRGEWDRTVVVVVSDHGEMNGDHGLFYKGMFLEAAVEIPLLVRDPARPQGRRTDALAEIHDAGATVLDLAGVEPSHETLARSLVDGATPRQVALSEFAGELMVFDGRHKLVVNADGESALLFDKEEDPGEAVNRVLDRSRRDVVEGLRDALFRALVRSQLGTRRRGKRGAFQAQVDEARRILEEG